MHNLGESVRLIRACLEGMIPRQVMPYLHDWQECTGAPQSPSLIVANCPKVTGTILKFTLCPGSFYQCPRIFIALGLESQ